MIRDTENATIGSVAEQEMELAELAVLDADGALSAHESAWLRRTIDREAAVADDASQWRSTWYKLHDVCRELRLDQQDRDRIVRSILGSN